MPEVTFPKDRLRERSGEGKERKLRTRQGRKPPRSLGDLYDLLLAGPSVFEFDPSMKDDLTSCLDPRFRQGALPDLLSPRSDVRAGRCLDACKALQIAYSQYVDEPEKVMPGFAPRIPVLYDLTGVPPIPQEGEREGGRAVHTARILLIPARLSSLPDR